MNTDEYKVSVIIEVDGKKYPFRYPQDIEMGYIPGVGSAQDMSKECFIALFKEASK